MAAEHLRPAVREFTFKNCISVKKLIVEFSEYYFAAHIIYKDITEALCHNTSHQRRHAKKYFTVLLQNSLNNK